MNNIRRKPSLRIVLLILTLVISLALLNAGTYGQNLQGPAESPAAQADPGLHSELAAALSVSSTALTIIPIDQSRTREEVVSMARLLPHQGFRTDYQTRYSVTPQFNAPYNAGALNADDIADALNAVKMVRYLAGVPYQSIAFASDLNSLSQHGATLLAASNQFSHSPSKPADMTQAFFDLAYRGCSEANLSAGCPNIANAVLRFMADLGSNNIQYAGHRRWILKPGADYFGIGYARNTAASYQGDRISMHVFSGLGDWQVESDSFIAWPSAGAFPLEYFYAGSSAAEAPAAPWSINLGTAYQVPVRSDITLQLTRLNDNKTWLFTAETTQLGSSNYTAGSDHLAVDDLGYGIGKAIIFRPNLLTLGSIRDGDRFQVSLSGIKTLSGSPATLTYTVDFFDLQQALAEPGTTCTISFDSRGGTAVGSQSAAVGDLAAKPAAPTRSGYIFVGWYADAACTIPWDFAANRVTGDLTLYARWLRTPVSGLSAVSASAASIRLTWAASSGADYYEVYRAASSAGTYSLIKTVAATACSFTDPERTTGTTYYYKVRAYSVYGGAKVYNGYSAIASAKPMPAVPANFKAASAGYASSKLSWTAVSGATGYKIYRATSSTGTYTLLRTTTLTSYTNTGLTTGKTYYYKIRAYRTIGTTYYYSPYTAVIGCKPVPGLPSSFVLAGSGTTGIKAAWGAVTGASGYEIYRATSSAGTYTLLKTTTLTSYTNIGLTAGNCYYYKVRAYHVEGTTRIYGPFTAVKYLKL